MESIIAGVFKNHNIINWGFAAGDGGDFYGGFKTGISFYVPLARGIMSEVIDSPTASYFHHYRTLNQKIDQVALDLTLTLEAQGYTAFPIAASQSTPQSSVYEGAFQHRTVARMAGLGYIGKNCSLITKAHGPRIRLGTVLTTYVPPSYGVPLDEGCGGCRICVDACPALALYDCDWSVSGYRDRKAHFDPKACSLHMHRAYQHIGRGVVCGICVTACPKGVKK